MAPLHRSTTRRTTSPPFALCSLALFLSAGVSFFNAPLAHAQGETPPVPPTTPPAVPEEPAPQLPTEIPTVVPPATPSVPTTPNMPATPGAPAATGVPTTTASPVTTPTPATAASPASPAVTAPPAKKTRTRKTPRQPLSPLALPPEEPTLPTDPATPVLPPGRDTAIDRFPGERDDAATPSSTSRRSKKGKAVTPPPTNSQLNADNLQVENGVVVASSNPGNRVQFENGPLRLSGSELRLDTNARTASVPGEVLVERTSQLRRRLLDARSERRSRYVTDTRVDTLRGDNFSYNFGTNRGLVDNVRLIASNLNVNARQVELTQDLYTARDVVVRPGGLTPEETRIYGRPPFSIRAKRATLTPAGEGSENTSSQVKVSGAGFYIGGTRLFPIPSALLGRSVGGREQQTFSLSPRISFSSADRLLITSQLAFALNPNQPERLQLVTDVGLSQRVGFRGGASIQSNGGYGRISVGGLLNDVVTTQLTNRIQLDRLPEASYRSPVFGIFDLPGGRRAGIQLSGTLGRYHESTIGGGNDFTGSRAQLGVTLTTRKRERDGLYGELFARTARYGNFDRNYSYTGFEVGYTGKVLPRVVGQLSYRNSSINGDTPFLFDRVQIRQEIRTTVDVGLTPRYILPFDLRYDVNRGTLRDARFGVLRSYKTFAYGLTYQTARNELRLDYRQAF